MIHLGHAKVIIIHLELVPITEVLKIMHGFMRILEQGSRGNSGTEICLPSHDIEIYQAYLEITSALQSKKDETAI